MYDGRAHAAPYRQASAPYWFGTTGSLTHFAGAIDMSNHEQRSNKESKKQPLHTAKEKKAAKQAKKHADEHPFTIGKKT
jgi:hypothetical protein